MSSELQVKSLRTSHGGYSAESGLLWEVEHNSATAQSQSDRNPLTKYHTSAVHSVEPEGVVAGISKVFSALNKLGLMAVFSKLSKLVKKNLLTYCYRPKVLEPVDITLVPLDAAKHVEDSFRVEVEKYLKVHGHDVVWVPSGAGLTVLLHQPEQRVNPQAVLEAIKSYRRRGGVVVVVFLLPHNPGLSSLPLGARDMTDDKSFRELEQSVRACADWYFWHMCSSRSQEERLKAFNLPAADLILSQVRSVQPDMLPSHEIPQNRSNRNAMYQEPPPDRFSAPYTATESDSLLTGGHRNNSRSSSGSQSLRRHLQQGWGPA